MRVFLSVLIILVLAGCNSAPDEVAVEETTVEFLADTAQVIVEEVDTIENEVEEIQDSSTISDSAVLIPQKTTYFKTIYHKDTLNQDSILIIEVYDKTTDSLIQEFVARIVDYVHFNGVYETDLNFDGVKDIYYKSWCGNRICNYNLHIYSKTDNKYGKPNEISDFYLSDENTLIESDGQVYDDPYLYEGYSYEYRWSDGSLILIKEERVFSDNIKNPSHERTVIDHENGFTREWNSFGVLVYEKMATDTNRYTIKKWNDDGKLILEENYINGELHFSKKY